MFDPCPEIGRPDRGLAAALQAQERAASTPAAPSSITMFTLDGPILVFTVGVEELLDRIDRDIAARTALGIKAASPATEAA